MTRLSVVPLSLDEANRFVERHHRHHGVVAGHKFSIGAAWGDLIVGVAIVGRPVSRIRDDGLTLEITRLCTDGVQRPLGRLNRRGDPCFVNACSFLYGAALRAAFALGYRRIGTYIRADEGGVSLDASSWRNLGEIRSRAWSCPSRPRVEATEVIGRRLFEVTA